MNTKIQVKIQGSLDFDEGSSSESEAEEENEPLTPPITINMREDDEEVEYFGGEKKKVPTQESQESRLASILASNVQEFENVPIETPTVTKLTPPEPPSNAPDEFGITYQSNRKPGQSTAAPIVTALEDYDASIEDRLLKSQKPEASEEDDEFDIDDDQVDNNIDAIKQAIEKAGTLEDTVSPIAPADAGALTQSLPLDSEIILNPESEDSTGFSIMEAAKRAFAEVSEVYGSGLGDQEVLISSVSVPATGSGAGLVDKNAVSVPLQSLKGISAIEEGDEEAAELEESEEEERERATQQAALQEAHALQSEWNDLNNIPEGSATGATECPSSTTDSIPAVLWSFTEALKYFTTVDYTTHRTAIVVKEEVRSGWFTSAPKPIAYKNFQPADLELPFLIAQIDYNPQSTEHYQMLSTLYNFFINSENPVDNVGFLKDSTAKNWEKLGFQGNDPRTDLNRSMKMLSVVQMLSFIEQDANMAQRLFDLSQSACDVTAGSLSVAERNARAKGDTSWPFFCVGILFTKEALQALRRGVLNDKCMKHQTIFGILNTFHRACFAEFESLLLEQPLVHHALHLATLRKLCETAPLKLLKKYKAAASLGNTTITTNATVPTTTTTAAVASSSIPPKKSKEASTVKPVVEDFRFDNLESVEAATTEGEARQEESGSGSSGSTGWTGGLFGKSKASKFAVL